MTSDRIPAAPGRTAPKSPRRWLMGAALAAAFLAGGVTTAGLGAAAQDMASHGAMGLTRPEMAHAMIAAHIAKVLDAVGATPEQKTKIGGILRSGFAPLTALHGDMRQDHARWHELMTAPTINRAALESLRAGEIARLDKATRPMVQSIADALEVLTPDQRARLAAMGKEGHGPS